MMVDTEKFGAAEVDCSNTVLLLLKKSILSLAAAGKKWCKKIGFLLRLSLIARSDQSTVIPSYDDPPIYIDI
jgi:hypothetical protein